jgi:ATP-dependent DNA helicase RecG
LELLKKDKKGQQLEMNRKTLTEKDVESLLARDEDHFFDRKALIASGRTVQKIAVAFSNADGGEFVIGIADEADEPQPQKRWNGAGKVEDFNSHIQALGEIKPPLPNAEFLILEAQGSKGLVLSVRVEKSSEVHQTADGTVYIRKGAQSLPLKEHERILELKFAKGAASFEDQILPNTRTEEVSEGAELRQFLSEYSPKSDPLEFALNQNLVDRNTWEPKVAGILLFNDSPAAVIPRKCSVKVVRYETKEDDPERDHLKSTVTLEGPLYPLIHETVKVVTDTMSSVAVWSTTGLKNLQYPPEAVWEIIVNAIIHRDYAISDDVQVRIFDNRIEVISPGKLPGYVSVQNILSVRYSRNSKIVRNLARYPSPPNKDLGEGLNTAFQKMKDWRLKEPEIVEDGNYVRVTIPHIPLAAPTEAILEFLKHNPTITNRQAREMTGIRSENLVKIEFYKLRDEGLLEMVPDLKGPAAAWRLKRPRRRS